LLGKWHRHSSLFGFAARRFVWAQLCRTPSRQARSAKPVAAIASQIAGFKFNTTSFSANSSHRSASIRSALVVAPFRTRLTLSIASEPRQPQNFLMKALAALLVFAGVAYAIYAYSLKKMPTSDSGTAPTQAISLTGVRGDLLQIAQSERSFLALNDHCANIDELISSNSITMRQPERDGYTYSVDCGSAGNFKATARHAPAPPDSPIRYPTLAIDQSMQVTEIQ
jgi:hypothetical protein